MTAAAHTVLHSKTAPKNGGRESEKLSDAVTHLLEECRMVLPGVQALFGFQWVAFFNQRFSDLADVNQRVHLAAIFLVAVSAALVMTPAAYHRSLGGEATGHFLTVSTRLIFASMFLLSLGIALDFYVVSTLVSELRSDATVLPSAGRAASWTSRVRRSAVVGRCRVMNRGY